MRRRQADLAAGLLVGAVLLVGLLFTWDAYAQQQGFDGQMGGMMGGDEMMNSMMYTGPDPLWYLLGTLVLAGAMGGSYLLLRSAVEFDDDALISQGERPDASPAVDDTTPGAEESGGESAERSTDGAAEQAAAESAERSGAESGAARPKILDVLPDDERRVLEPVIESPGLTQIALRDRSGFSKSKVSQTASELEKRGLIYREKQGRTYRIYPSDDLADR